jgi:predicted permease
MRERIPVSARLRRLGRRFLFLFRGNKVETEMAEEMRLHIELQAAEFRETGMAADEAELRARLEFGHMDGIRERCRDEKGFLWVSQIGQDLRYAWRTLARSPCFTLAAVLTLALGIGVNTAIFSLVDEILLKQLPVAAPRDLVLFHWASKVDLPVPTSGGWERDPVTQQTTCTSFSLPAFEAIRTRSQALSGIAAFAPISRLTIVADGNAEVVELGQLVSGGYFSVMGIAPAVGRLLEATDAVPGAPAVAMVSYRYWMRRFGGDPSMIGKAILVNRVPVTIVGVVPRRFPGSLQVGDTPDLFLPLVLARSLGAFEMIDNPDALWWVQMIGRLGAGMTPLQAVTELEPVFQQSAQESLKVVGAPPPKSPGDLPSLKAGPGGQGLNELRNEYRQRWEILTGLGVAILAIACANLASLLLARGAARQREMGVRLAMGASRGRIVRQLLTESLLLAGLGGALAVPFAVGVEVGLVAMQPRVEGHTLSLVPQLDPGVFLTAAAISVFTGVVFGLVPAVRASRVNISAEFQGGASNRTGSRSWLGKSLLVIQVALALVLLVGAGLFAGTLRNLASVDVGFESRGLLLFHLMPNPDGSSFKAGLAIDNEIAERLRAVPGVASATFSRMPLLSDMGWNTRIAVVGRPPRDDGQNTTMVNFVASDFFSTYAIPIMAGRAVDMADEARGGSVAVVNQAFVREFFGAEDPLGRTLQRPDAGNMQALITVVGVARDASYSAVRYPAPPTIYFPYNSQASAKAEATFAVRASGDPRALFPLIRETVRSVAPMLPLDDLRTQQAQIRELSATERMFAWLSAVFSLLATGLVSLGLYGLMSYSVLGRQSEIGLRIALGARPTQVVWMIVCEGLLLVGMGVGLGLMGAYAATRVVSSLLFGLSATDPGMFAAGGALLLLVAVIAGWMPAQRASRVNPMVALRAD